MPSTQDQQAPIGVFDSGIGGLSVLRALQQRMPHEHFVYVADSGHAPYGEKSNTFILQRSSAVSHFLRHQHACKALVIACNTATASAAAELRQLHATWPIIGIEPAIKPAAQQTHSGSIGVWATRATLNSDKYNKLRARVLQAHPKLHLQDIACDGLAGAIEALAHTPHVTSERLQELVAHYARALTADTDTLVLGCTHYPLIAATIAQYLPPHVQLLDPGSRVAEHTHAVLEQAQLLASPNSQAPSLSLWSSEAIPVVGMAAQHWLQTPATLVHPLCV